MNHVNEKALGKTIEMFSKEPDKAVKEFSVEGEWILEEGAPQFRARIPTEKGEATLSMGIRDLNWGAPSSRIHSPSTENSLTAFSGSFENISIVFPNAFSLM